VEEALRILARAGLKAQIARMWGSRAETAIMIERPACDAVGRPVCDAAGGQAASGQQSAEKEKSDE